MKRESVAAALIAILADVKESGEIPVIGKLMKMLPIDDLHAELVAAYRAACTKWGFGVQTDSTPGYQKHHQRVIEDVAASVMSQARVPA